MGALNPWGLLFGLGIIPIIYLYFIKQEKTVLEVSSIIPWKRLEEDRSSAKEKFAVDLLLLLQILAILAIALMLARIYYKYTAKVNHSVLIVDASASMKTREPGGATRLDMAKTQSYKLIDNMFSDDRMMVVRMAGAPEKLSGFISDKDRLEDIVKSIRAGDTQTNFRSTLSLALSEIQGLEAGRIYVLGDRSRDSQNVHHLLDDMENAAERLIFKPVGENSDNVAITSLDIYQSVYENVKKKIYITIHNYFSQPQNPVLKVFIGSRLVYREKVKLPPNGFRVLPFGNIRESGLLEVKIEQDDALASDNTAYGLIRENKVIRLLLVTENKEFFDNIDRICKAAKNIHSIPVFPDDLPNVDLDNFDIALFHKNTPGSYPPINSIFIDPPPGNMLLKVSTASAKNPAIVDWNRKHPALKYLNFLDTIQVEQAHEITLPPWAAGLIYSRDFPLAFRGTYNDHKRIVFGFDPGENFSSTSQNITGLILFLNLIDWITPTQVNIYGLKTGEEYLLESEEDFEEVIVEKPDGAFVDVEKKEGRFVFTDTETAGVYRVKAVRKNGSELLRIFFTNLLDENESRIKPAVSSAPPIAIKSSLPDSRRQQREIWRYLLLCALLFLLVEWWVYFRRVE
jgi:hypothetical protein